MATNNSDSISSLLNALDVHYERSRIYLGWKVGSTFNAFEKNIRSWTTNRAISLVFNNGLRTVGKQHRFGDKNLRRQVYGSESQQNISNYASI
ncbi:15850_t:CDS:2 [Funneliformis mosseae]|uniref:15850_t:CDS:1 n=1 Tax=Funneliformis mosseae TaxID=27381 RepID=A0A9N9ALD8_FUNMO|nr:15850_t:CDS:2 [Funneliformis mosseae]